MANVEDGSIKFNKPNSLLRDFGRNNSRTIHFLKIEDQNYYLIDAKIVSLIKVID